LLEAIAWAIFLGLGPILWASGVWLFSTTPLTLARKVAWTLFLVTVGIVIGRVLPMEGIRNRFLVLLASLPLLALVDIKLAKSNRSFVFWFRACAFEVCTVFGCAAIIRIIFQSTKGAP
jgi:hypothetical protein